VGTTKSGVRLPLHITISTLFIGLIVLLGAVLTYQSYTKSSQIILSSAAGLHERISEEIQLEFKATYRPVVGSMQLLALSPIIQAGTRDERMQSLPLLTAALSEVEAISGIQLGYANGDYFIVRPLRSEHMKKQFAAPAKAHFVADHIETTPSSERQLSRVFFDAELNLVQEDVPVPTGYDPRERPWYIEAQASPVATQPYLFHFIRKVGTTVALRTPEKGVVIASDVSLEQFSDTIAAYRVTPDSEAVIIGSDGHVLAYHDGARVIESTADAQLGLTHISGLESPVLSRFSERLDVEPRRLDFEYGERRWVGSIDRVAKNSSLDMNVLLLSPVDELLADAVAVGRTSLFITLGVIALCIPVVWLVSTRVAGPMRRLAAEANAIRRFDFDAPVKTRSSISEVDALAEAMRMMKSTINQFVVLINSLAGEKEFDALLERITHETMHIAQADAAVAYLVDDEETRLHAETHEAVDGKLQRSDLLPDIDLGAEHPLAACLHDGQAQLVDLDAGNKDALAPLLDLVDGKVGALLTVPLRNRQDQPVGVLCLLFRSDDESVQPEERRARIEFLDALSGFAAVSIESRHLLKMQAALLDAFIKLIAGAIDSKSPYTGGHCQRVPELTRMLAEAACNSREPPFVDFDLSSEDWEALHIASWLHDCGKVTTPEYVVDKSTKLETIYDRIHEIRMRFEVLKRDAQIRYWELLSEGGDRQALRAALDAELARLDKEFAFVAECNEGGEFMAPERLQRLRRIARRTWTRTLDDRIGISWEERKRKQQTTAPTLPVSERLIDDKPEHLIERPDAERMPDGNPWGFRLDVPEYQYNRGELYNLEVARGTLSDEERFKINDHVVQTIIMLSKLPYPKHLRDVPEIAGGHHETMDGKGYPKRLTSDETSLAARIMAIADIFEALTASDRPYKKAKTLSESIRIMSLMEQDAHIDPDLFRLFLQSGVWKIYAERFLDPAQIDRVDLGQYLV
jgi:HD-GYP domain-containing protein (c-di-GMP phosphodiesterase class II)